MPQGLVKFLAEVAQRYSHTSDIAALVLSGAALVGLVAQSAVLAGFDTRSALMDTALAIERLETELVAEIDRLEGDPFAEFIAENELLSATERLEDSLAAALGKLTNLPERFRGKLAVLVGDHFAALRQRVQQLRSDLVEIWDLRTRMFGAMDELVRAPGVEQDLYAAVVEVVTLVHGHAQDEVLPTTENVWVAVARVREAAANSAPGTAALASEFATQVVALAERRVAVQGKFGEIHTVTQQGGQDIHQLVGELQAEWWDAAETPAWVVLALTLALLLFAVGKWAILTGRYKDTRNSPSAGTRFDPTAAIVSGICAARVSGAAGEIRHYVSSLRVIPQYASGVGTSGAKAVGAVHALGVAIERTAADLGRFAATAMPTRTGKAVGLAQCIVSAVAAARKSAGGDVGFEVSTGNARVLSSSDDVRLMLGNVLANAAEADDGRTRTSLVRILIKVDSDHAEASVLVTDNGPGMTKRVQNRAFDLFFTTKANRLGAGLAVTRQLATNWGGSTSISQSEGSGTTIRISLPLATDDDAKAEVRQARANLVLRPWRPSEYGWVRTSLRFIRRYSRAKRRQLAVARRHCRSRRAGR